MKKQFAIALVIVVATFGVWAAAYGQAISPLFYGQNAWMPHSHGNAVYHGQIDDLWDEVQASGIKLIRIGGISPDENIPTLQQYLSTVDSIRRIGAEPLVQISRKAITADHTNTAEARKVIEYLNVEMGRGIKYWAIGNEPDWHWDVDMSNKDPNNPYRVFGPQDVEEYFKAIATTLKEVDPTIKIVGPDCAWYNDQYLNALIGGANDITGKVPGKDYYYLDVVSWHYYVGFGGELTSRKALVEDAPNNFRNNLAAGTVALLNVANNKHGRVGNEALTWGLGEFNVSNAQLSGHQDEYGLSTHSFLAGQYWADIFSIMLENEAFFVTPWSIHESGGSRGETDFGYFDGTDTNKTPRATYYHMQLMARHIQGQFVPGNGATATLKAFGSQQDSAVAVMLLNQEATAARSYALHLDAQQDPVAGQEVELTVPLGVAATHLGSIAPQTTQVLLFSNSGQLLETITYSVVHSARKLPPTVSTGQEPLYLTDIVADDEAYCLDGTAPTFSAFYFHDYDSVVWNFGPTAEEPLRSGPGPFTVRYLEAGSKDVSITLYASDTTISYAESGVVQVNTCVRSPYLGQKATIPGTLLAVNYDEGGEGIAYHDNDPDVNQGNITTNPGPRPEEGVDTEGGDGTGNIGWIDDGEWLRYTIDVTAAGTYLPTARVASEPGGGAFRVRVNSEDVSGLVTVEATGGWATFVPITLPELTLEEQEGATLELYFEKGLFNVSSISFAPVTVAGLWPKASALPLAVYPNPAQQQVQLVAAQRLTQATLYTPAGQQVAHYALYGQQQLNVSSLAPGMYLLMAQDAQQRPYRTVLMVE